VFVVFVSHLGRPAHAEADAIASSLGITPYEARLSLAAAPPCIVQTSATRDRAEGFVVALRSRGHGAHLFDDAAFVPSQKMVPLDDFAFDADGLVRVANGDMLAYGDVFAILRAVHDTSDQIDHSFEAGSGTRAFSMPRNVTKRAEREHVAYFFRRSGACPWVLRERHARYMGLGDELGPIAFANFRRVLERVHERATGSVMDDRLVRRRVAERRSSDGTLSMTLRTSQEGMDLLAHLLAMTIASQGGSPYR
jgi:hypothetical protein